MTPERINQCFILLGFLVVSSCSPSQPESIQSSPLLPDQQLNVAFLLVDGVYNTELIAPMDIFQHTVYHTDLGMRVFTVAQSRQPIVTFEGLTIIPDYAFDSDSLPGIDILVVASARNSMTSDLEDEKMIDFVRQSGSRSRYVMSLCDGAFVLAQAGLVDGKESTTFPSDIPKYRKRFSNLTVHENVSFVHHDNLITSAGGIKSYEVALYLTELLYGSKPALGIAGGLVIDWDLGKVDHLVVQ